jgi:hypothetical protein
MRTEFCCGNVTRNVAWKIKKRWEDSIHMNHRDVEHEGGRWMEPAQNHAQWGVLLLVVLCLRVLLT